MPARELIGPCDLEVGRKELVPACLHNGIVGRGSAEVCYPYLSRLFPTYIDELVGRLGRFDSAGVEEEGRLAMPGYPMLASPDEVHMGKSAENRPARAEYGAE